MNKKFFIILLAISLLFVVSLPIFAENLETDSKDITVSVDADGNGVPDDKPGGITDPTKLVYSYELTWESLDFVYFGGKWNPESGKYTDGTWQVAGTADSSQNITVTNKSNAPITVSAATNAADMYGVDVSVSGAAVGTGVTLPSAASKTVASTPEAVTTSITVSVSGDPTVTDGFSVGTITVTISK